MKWFDEFAASQTDEHNIKGFVGPNRWLSNFWPCRILYDGLKFTNLEAAYQSAKILNKDMRLWSFTTATASQAKKLGKQIPLRPDWEAIKVGIMEDLLRYKFHPVHNQELAEMLVNTGDKYLEETNWWNDKFWGVCKGEGENTLGKLLMKIRKELIDGSI